MFDNLRCKLRRLRARWLIWWHSADQLNRRAKVERYLFDCAEGQRPLPDADKCRALALQLGIPENLR